MAPSTGSGAAADRRRVLSPWPPDLRELRLGWGASMTAVRPYAAWAGTSAWQERRSAVLGSKPTRTPLASLPGNYL